jgi:hypothetical protein
MGVIGMLISAIKNLPVLMGKAEVLKIIQFLPAVVADQEGITGVYVRAGNHDQNLE